MKDDTVRIDCHSGWSRGFLRLCLLTMPVWLTWSVVGYVTAPNQMYWGIPGFIFHPVLFFGPMIMLVGLVQNRMLITKDRVILPSFWGANAKLPDLLGVQYVKAHGELEFICRKQIMYLSLRKLNRARLHLLVQTLKQRAPNCQIPATLHLDLFPASQKDSDEAAGTITIKYRSHERIVHLVQSLLFCEKQVLPFWLFVSVLPLIVVSPFLYWTAVKGVQNSYNMPEPINTYSKYFSDFGTVVSSGFTSYSKVFENPYTIATVCGAVLLCAWWLMQYIFQPNYLAFSPSEFMVITKLGWFKARKRFNWEEITQFTLDRNESFINVFRVRGAPVRLRLDAINVVDRQRIITALNRFATNIKRDANFLEAMTPPQKASYTELWLQSLSAPPKRNSLLPLADGQLLRDGKFRILRQLGTGGQGSAYLAAVPEEANAQVVLKEFILPVYVDKEVRKLALEKFEHEARLLQNLDHPQIVKMLDYFLEDHRAYLVLQHIDGFSLRQIIESTEADALPDPQWVIDLAVQMCQILEYLHCLAPPLVHRDFTPDNLILDKEGVLKLIDFDVAQQREQSTSATVVGKHAYLPPEQFRGKPCPQSDIYALGATLHFLLTGQDPEPLNASHPQQLRSQVSSKLDALVARCTSLELNVRYQSAEEIKADLLELCGGTADGATAQAESINLREKAVCE